METKIGVFGGSFNPVHNGHLLLAEHAAKQLGIDRVLFMIDRIPPHKTLAEGATDDQRLEILRLSVSDYPNFTVDTMELEREGPSYTVDTLRELKCRQPDSQLYFFMGSDMLNSFLGWRCPEEIAKLATLVCTVRGGQNGGEAESAEILQKQLGATVILLDEVSDLSSTTVRNRIHDALPITGMVPDKAAHYIYLHGCYQPADLKLDIEDTGLQDGAYDVIICNHVLEHVSDFRKALKELHRIVRPDGMILLSFPVDEKRETIYEDESIRTEEGRRENFGQSDHLRIFGADSTALLESFGFTAEEIRGEDCDSSIKPVIGPADYDYNVLWRLTRYSTLLL